MNIQQRVEFEAQLRDNWAGTLYGLRLLEDGTYIGLHKLLYTTALIVDLDSVGYARRYCYEDPLLAYKALEAMKTGDDEPLPGYVASR